MSFPTPIELCGRLVEPGGTDDSIEFCPEHFARWWPEDIVLPESVLPGDWNNRSRIYRSQLFALGRSVENEHDALEFFASVAAYGSGTQARSVYRACRAPGVSGFAAAIASLIDQSRGMTAQEAFTLWNGAVPYVGPSTFTKLVFFSQPDWNADSPLAPMILDGRILRTLDADGAAISSCLYSTYLELLTAVAQLKGWTQSQVEQAWTQAGLKMLNTAGKPVPQRPDALL